jgi:hypothetical protein
MALTWFAVRIVMGSRLSSRVWFQFILVRARISLPMPRLDRIVWTGLMPIGCGTYMPGDVE